MRTRWLASVAMLAVSCAATAEAETGTTATSGQPHPACARAGWVSVWSMPTSDAAGTPLEAGQTLRETVYPHLGGQAVRVKFSNRFGATPVVIGRATIGLRQRGADVVPHSIVTLRFRKAAGVTIAPGGEVWSDPAAFSFAALRELSVSLYVASAVPTPAEHMTGQQENYVAPRSAGDRVRDPRGRAFGRAADSYRTPSPFSSTTIVSGVDALSPSTLGSVAALGDSLTDGLTVPGAAEDNLVPADDRWPDVVARRLRAAGIPLSIVDAGISGNRLTADSLPLRFGVSAAHRFRPDVLSQAGVRTVIVSEGINDIHSAESASEIVAADRALIGAAHAAHLRILLATLTADGRAGDAGDTEPATVERREVNAWIRSQRLADGVIDFDAATADPRNPTRLAPAYDGGDHLHLSRAGYAVLGKALPLASLLPAGCPAPRPHATA